MTLRLIDFAKNFSKSTIDLSTAFPKKILLKLTADLIYSSSKTTADDYASFSVFFSLAVSLAFSSIVLIYYGLTNSLLAFILFFSLLLVFLLFLPFIEKKKRASIIEAELSFALRSASVSLMLGVSFEKLLTELSEYTGELGKEFGFVLMDVERGSSVLTALSASSKRVDSDFFKRACFELAFCYEHGIKNEGLRRLADELSLTQNARVKEFSSKLSFLGVVFVVVSCVLPALFGAYVIVGSTFMELSYTSLDVLLAFALFFPVLDSIILVLVYSSKPVVLR